jgi:hypothetical protein
VLNFEIHVDPPMVAVDDQFTVAIGTPPLDRDTETEAEFVVALDASLSMTEAALGPDHAGPTRWDLAREGALALLDVIPDGTRTHVVLFANEAQVVAQGEARTLRSRLAGQLPDAPSQESIATDIEAALRASYRLLEDSDATSRTVVLLTDGVPNQGRTNPSDLEAIVADAADRDIYTRPIGFGVDANVELLFRISSDGSSAHVKTGSEAREAMTSFMRQLGTVGRDAVASGGDLTVTVSPFFNVLGVYQLTPSERRLERVTRPQPDDSTIVQLRLGSIGAGDDRPVFALRLRAPSKANSAPLPVLRCEGVIRTGQGDLKLNQTSAEVQLTLERIGHVDGATADLIDGIDLDSEVRRQAEQTPQSRYPEMYEAALKQATQKGLSRQIELYQNTLRNIRSGGDPRDEYLDQQSTSSRAVTHARDLLDRPVIQPVPRPRPETPTPFGDDDDETPTKPGGLW